MSDQSAASNNGYRFTGAAFETEGDPAGARATRLDGDVPGAGATRLDGAEDDPARTRLDQEPPAAPGWTDPSRLPPGLAARFRSCAPLTAGAQALVYRAQTPDGQELVVRVARPGVALGASDIDLTAITSPHLVRMLETGTVDGVDFQILEYIAGPSVAERLRSTTRLPEPLVRRFVEHLAEALATLGDARLVHGDIKPENVLMRGTEADGAFVVIDFGLTRGSRHTVMRDPVPGTLLYFPPEGCAGFLTLMWDWWSLGMMVVELLTGRHPLADADPETVHLAILNRRFNIDAVTDVRWQLLVRGLLTADHEHRWGAEQVRQWLAGGSPPVVDSAAPGAEPPRTIRFAGRTFVADPRRLADALGRHWEDAARLVGSPASRALLVDWARQFHDAGLLTALDGVGRSGRSLDLDLATVAAALYAVPVAGRGRVPRIWYRGRRLHLDVLRALCAEALASADQLANTSGGPDDLVGTEALHTMALLVEGDLAALAAISGERRPVGRLHARFEAGRSALRAGTADLDPPAEHWEETLWAIQLLHCLTSSAAERAMRVAALRDARLRPDLRSLVAPGTGSAQHLLATIRGRRARTRPAASRHRAGSGA